MKRKTTLSFILKEIPSDLESEFGDRYLQRLFPLPFVGSDLKLSRFTLWVLEGKRRLKW